MSAMAHWCYRHRRIVLVAVALVFIGIGAISNGGRLGLRELLLAAGDRFLACAQPAEGGVPGGFGGNATPSSGG